MELTCPPALIYAEAVFNTFVFSSSIHSPVNSTRLVQKVSGRMCLKFCCVGSTAYCAYRDLWPGGLSALAIRVCTRENGATVKSVTTCIAFKEYNLSTF